MNVRYRAGWWVPQQVLALTHFVSDVSADDFAGIAQDTYAALQQVNGEFHVIIDNRIIANTELASLDTMLAAMPMMNHSQLRWIVMVLPEKLSGTAQQMATQQHEQIGLKHVDSLGEAKTFLNSVDETIDWEDIQIDFFEKN